jgi:hypothetical protein
MVAVAADFSDPPQQSEMLGHRASSHTVCRFNPRRSFLIRLKLSPTGTGVFSHSGRRVISFFLPGGPTSAVRSSSASEGSRGSAWGLLTKSENDGPALSLFWKVVGFRRGGVGVVSVVVGSGDAVANPRVEGSRKDFEDLLRDNRRQRKLPEDVAMVFRPDK